MTVVEELEAALREARSKNAGIAMAALWIAGELSDAYGRKVLESFGLDAPELRAADAVERIECYGATVDDAIALLTEDH